MERKEAIEALLHAFGCFSRHRPLSPVNRNLQGEAFALGSLCKEPQGMTPGELGKRLGVSAPRVAAILDSLETKGLITRTPSPADRRKYLVAPTEAGLQQDTRHRQFAFQRTEELLSCLDDGEIEALTVIIRKLNEAHCKEESPC